jgi:hypothetical protein
MLSRIKLRHYRLISRQPYLDIDGAEVVFRIPNIFGPNRTWRVPVESMVVIDDQDVGGVPDDTGEGWVFTPALRVPYLATTTTSAKSNVTILFTVPIRIPAVKPFGGQQAGLSYRQSRKTNGIIVDGVELRAVDPITAVQTLAAAGVQRVQRPNIWLRSHRATTTDPVAVQAVASSVRRFKVGAVVVLIAVIALQLLRFFSDDVSTANVFIGLGILVAIIVGTPMWLRWRDRKQTD